jgi:hypothetical protein
MALDSYSGLLASAASWLNRQDLTAVIPDFITMAEAQINRELRVIDMETRSEAVSTAEEWVPVPDDWLETRQLSVMISSSIVDPPLRYVGEEEAIQLKARLPTGTPRWYTITASQFDLIPASSSSGTTLELIYYARIPALSTTNTSNWLLVKSPDLYLYSTLLEAEAYMKDDDRLPVWAARRNDCMEKMRLESERAKRSQTRLTARRSSYG